MTPSVSMQTAVYALKEGTKSSYYHQQGCRILPNRLSITQGTEMSNVQHKGRNLAPLAGQLIGTFCRAEQSPLKQHKPFVCRTQLWQLPTHPQLIGYGTTGISNPLGRVQDTGDLIVLQPIDQWETIRIYYFPNLGNPAGLQQALTAIDKKEGAGFTAHTPHGF